MVGALAGLFIAMFWAASTGNLMMGEDEYERRRAAQATCLLIIGSSAIIGALIGLVRNRLKGAVAKKLNDPKLVSVIAGLMVCGLLGFFLAIFWAACTGNLMMAADEYERRKAATATIVLIIGCTGMVGGLIGFLRNRK